MKAGNRWAISRKLAGLGALVAAAVAATGGCSSDGVPDGASLPASTRAASGTELAQSEEARTTVAALAERFGELRPGSARSLRSFDAAVVVDLGEDPETPPPRVRLSEAGTPSWELTDTKSQAKLTVRLEGSRRGRAEASRGLVTYRDAAPGGGAMVVRPARFGVEDFVEVTDSAIGDLAYRVELANVAGLRLVEGTLELLDETGDPRLRVTAPAVIDSARTQHPARLTLEGCAADTSPADPWKRPVTAPGSKSCLVRVAWDRHAAKYPVLADPAWSGPYDMSAFRVGHSAVRYGSGTDSRVLVAGGRSSTTTYLASAELFNPSTNTWAATGSMPGAKAYFTLSVFSDLEQPFAVGGQTSSTPTYTGSNYRYNIAGGNWSTMTAMPTARAFHAAIPASSTFPVEMLYVTGGTNDPTSPYSALTTHERYSSKTNAWVTLAPMSAARMTHALFDGGSVFVRVPQVAGGASSCTASTCNALNTSERYDITGNSWSSGGTLPASISHATYVYAAKLLVGDGATAALWTGAASWSSVPAIPQSVTWPAAGAAGGDAIVGGGPQDAFKFTGTVWQNADHPNGAFIYYPTFTQATATDLEDGSVLFAGGFNSNSDPVKECFRFKELAQGSICSKDGECNTNYCVDGFCCNSSCTGLCQACSNAKKGQGSNGVCGPVISGSDPDSDCGDDGAASCNKNGLCDGAGACQLYVQGTQCQQPSCVTGQLTTYACNGSGVCLSSQSSCNGYSCSSSTACNTTCTTDVQCMATHYCAANKTCQPKLANGQTCTADGQCTNGHCVDTVCCDTACTGNCQACSATKKGPGGGPDGSCGPVANGTDPDDNCADQGAGSCQQDGQCNGAGACRLYAAGVPCGSTVCVGNSTTGQICNGSGACINDSTGTSCSPYVCSGGACVNPCITDASCLGGYYCSSGTCSPKLANGQTCTSANQCTNGICVDGVCCDSACSGLCQACSAAKKGGGADGNCGPVQTGLDPDDDCAVSGQCGNDGTCNGAGACRLRASGSPCGSPVCVANTLTPQQCDGLGACVNSSGGTDCAPFVCQSGACATPCTVDTHCVNGYFCDAGTCVAKLAKGTPCTAGNQCGSGNCVDGVCCDTGCSGLCQACSAAKKGLGNDGDCGPIAAGADPDNECAVGGQCGTDGFCNGSGACELVPAGTPCGATQCVGNNTTGQICNGSGACVTDAVGTDCSPSLCVGGACAKPCNSDSQCINNYYCDTNGNCQQKKAQGTSCTGNNQCGTGFCVDGVCCSSACSSPCSACSAALKESGIDGDCGPAKNGLDPHNDCPDDGALTCQRDGVCNGNGACRLYQQGVACGAASCVGNTVKGKICNGIGTCITDTNGTDCAPYLCLSGGCATSCQNDSECLGGTFCNSGLCAQKGAVGASCTAALQCASGFCVDGVCCNTACGGQCEACDESGSVGTCKPVAGVPHGTRAACSGSGTCGGACDGADATKCTYPGATTFCTGTKCTGSVFEPWTCDGQGGCVKGATQDCGNYACDSTANACKTSCASNDDCAPGAACDTLKGECAAQSSSCADAYTVKLANGQTQSCAPYKCVAGACQQQCSVAGDCAPGYECSTANACVASSDAGTGGAGTGGTGGTSGAAGTAGSATGGTPSSGSGDDGGGCGCAVPKRRSGLPTVALLAVLGVAVRRRARRTRPPAGGARPPA